MLHCGRVEIPLPQSIRQKHLQTNLETISKCSTHCQATKCATSTRWAGRRRPKIIIYNNSSRQRLLRNKNTICEPFPRVKAKKKKKKEEEKYSHIENKWEEKSPNNFLRACKPLVAIIYRLSAKIFQLNHKDSISQAIYITETPYQASPIFTISHTNEQHSRTTNGYLCPENHVVSTPENVPYPN